MACTSQPSRGMGDDDPAGRSRPPGQLHAELRRLCRGRGLLAADLPDRVGPSLTAMIGGAITDPAELRAALTGWLSPGLAALPEDLELAARVALSLHPGAQQRFLGERLDWLAGFLGRDPRTVRRRVDEALGLLPGLLYQAEPRAPGPASPPGDQPDSPVTSSWYTESLHTLLHLDQSSPEVHEVRRIVATAASLDTVTVPVSLPRADGTATDLARDLNAEVLYGGVAVTTERPSESQFRFTISLPQPLRAGARHTFALRLRIPADQPMAPHYALVPLHRCDEFRLRVRFAAGRTPHRLGLVHAMPPRMLDDDSAGLPPVELDQAGEAEVSFVNLALGLGYGLRWQP